MERNTVAAPYLVEISCTQYPLHLPGFVPERGSRLSPVVSIPVLGMFLARPITTFSAFLTSAKGDAFPLEEYNTVGTVSSVSRCASTRRPFLSSLLPVSLSRFLIFPHRGNSGRPWMVYLNGRLDFSRPCCRSLQLPSTKGLVSTPQTSEKRWSPALLSSSRPTAGARLRSLIGSSYAANACTERTTELGSGPSVPLHRDLKMPELLPVRNELESRFGNKPLCNGPRPQVVIEQKTDRRTCTER